MVRGLDTFRQHFGAFSDQYVLIGGAACDLLMEEAGLPFRATKDLDIVLCVEVLDASFVRALWEFVRAGEYEIRQSEAGRRRYYRFQKPQREEYPSMLELFSRKPDLLDLAEGTHLTPIPVDGEISSLSAILLDDVYYNFLRSGKRIVEGISVVGPEHLIPLKARAWLDLSGRKRAGEVVDGKTIAKHKNDVFRLYRLLDPALEVSAPEEAREDMGAFVDAMRAEAVDLAALGIKGQSIGSICEQLGRFYAQGW